MSGTPQRCEHFGDTIDVAARSRTCEGCSALGERWNELRVCQTCGHVGCCEDSKHAHALQHFRTTGHPLIMPLSRDERWAWCYVHHQYFQDVRAAQAQGAGVRGWWRRLTGR